MCKSINLKNRALHTILSCLSNVDFKKSKIENNQ